jgi:SWI/SNF-related matrix-associated actin-dependent regulator 1 of chromatin subfamily A
MGLGKTAQVVTFLAHLKETGEEGPFLIVVPASTISNWLREFEKFCPDLDVRSYYGSQAEREEIRYELEQDPTFNVLVTTYSLATGNNDERKFLNRRGFKGIVLDEGHMVKNCTSARYKQLMSIKTPFRLLLTGTPLQNNLEELLSLMIFIMPKLFAEHEEVLRTMFKVKVDATSEKSTLLSQERIIRARHMLAPFVLRRKKIHVLKDLPPKVEHVVYCDLLPAQRILYDSIMKSSTLQDVLEESDVELDVIELDSMDPKDKAKAMASKKTKKPTAASKKAKAAAFANVLMQLRKAADHPMLFRELYTDAKLKEMSKVITREVEFCDSNIEYIEEDMTVMTDFELDRLCKQYKVTRCSCNFFFEEFLWSV